MKKIKRLKFKRKKKGNSKKREIFGILNCSAVIIS
jgi:hypothetical protein